MTFYDGDTEEIDIGRSVWISEEHFDRIRRRLALPESLRRSCEDAKFMSARKRASKKIKESMTQSVMLDQEPYEDMSRDHLRDKIGMGLFRK